MLGSRRLLPFVLVLLIAKRVMAFCAAAGYMGVSSLSRSFPLTIKRSGRFFQCSDRIRLSHFGGANRRWLINSTLKCTEVGDTTRQVRLEIPTAEDMEDIGGVLSTLLIDEGSWPRGSIVFLDGDLGAGKTAFARGFVRAAIGDPVLRVTSPTYLLSNTYALRRGYEIHHMDLYRLSENPEDLMPLNLDQALSNGISLIEWPIRLGRDKIPPQRLEVHITIPSEYTVEDVDTEDKLRHLTMTPYGSIWEERLQRLLASGYVDDLILEP
jgi:tRNA threonylcarbamoyladenosine biosynthesis protein TsaE